MVSGGNHVSFVLEEKIIVIISFKREKEGVRSLAWVRTHLKGLVDTLTFYLF